MKGMTVEWQNPDPVARYCVGCGCQMICGRQQTTANTAADMTDDNTWAMCPVCGRETGGHQRPQPGMGEKDEHMNNNETNTLWRERTCGEGAIGISTIEELQLIGNDPAYPLDGYYVLTQDIDASATREEDK